MVRFHPKHSISKFIATFGIWGEGKILCPEKYDLFFLAEKLTEQELESKSIQTDTIVTLFTHRVLGPVLCLR